MYKDFKGARIAPWPEGGVQSPAIGGGPPNSTLSGAKDFWGFIRILTGLAVLGFFCLAACRGIESDTLYARCLPGPPDESDWEFAVPLRVMVSGGSVHRELKPMTAQEVDQDTVHKNSASCHHGPSQQTAFPVWLRAYYDQRNIYLRLSWPDLTMDRENRRWVRQDGSWKLEGREGDGVALVFPLDKGASFTCAMICHLDDWSMDGGRFMEAARMRYDGEGRADLWMWRASDRSAMSLMIDGKGVHPVRGPDRVRTPNSRLAFSGEKAGGGTNLVFGPDDEPFADAAGAPLPSGYRPAQGAQLPAYLPLPPSQRDSNIRVGQRYRNGLWEITLTRPLATGDPGDMVFSGGRTYLFGLSVMDDTLRNHHIADTAWKLKMIS